MFIHHDINNSVVLLLMNYGITNVDEIYNLACPASPPKYQIDPIFTLKTNFIGTMNLLELAIQKKSKILLASTSEIYGEPEVSPQSETYRGNVNTLGIRSCYDEGKRIAETLMMDYHRQFNVNTRIVRIFNTYGPNMDKYDGRVVTNLIRQMINNEDITIYGDGTQTRSFCYIDDLLEGIIRLMASEYHYPVNIGNTNEITVNELSNILLDMIETKSKITFLPLPHDDPTNRRPDITLANKILGWEPKVELKNGLEKTIEYLHQVI
jgi:UDP-glucuronate decarboxylase